jgi:uncharacterized protein (DUF1015 family)
LIRPFCGVRYRGSEAELSRRLSPPYDVITAAGRQALLERDPHNVVRLILTKSQDPAEYAKAGKTLEEWIEAGILATDAEPSLYVLEQRFEIAGVALERHGLLARFRAEDPETGAVLPHEQTRKAPKEDRYRLLRATRANFSPLFLMVSDHDGGLSRQIAAAKQQAALCQSHIDEDGVGHRLFRVSSPERIAAFSELLARRAYIADGHHRYATALRYRDEHGPDGAWTLGYFTALEDPGLVVLPYHRILSSGPSLVEVKQRLAPYFDLEPAAGPSEAAAHAARSTARYCFGLAEPDAGAVVATARPDGEALLSDETPPSLAALDAYFLHHVVLERLLGVGSEAVRYVHSLSEAVVAVRAAECRLALLLRATPVTQIVDVAEARESMPAKSTFFHPKLPSGLVIHRLVTAEADVS